MMLGPNITGDHGLSNGDLNQPATGCFTYTTPNVGGENSSAVHHSGKVTLNAKKSSSLFGASSTVQPASMTALILIKF